MQIFGRRLMIHAQARLWLQFPVLTAHYFSANGGVSLSLSFLRVAWNAFYCFTVAQKEQSERRSVDDGDDEEANEEDVPADARVRHKWSSFLVRFKREHAFWIQGLENVRAKEYETLLCDVKAIFSGFLIPYCKSYSDLILFLIAF